MVAVVGSAACGGAGDGSRADVDLGVARRGSLVTVAPGDPPVTVDATVVDGYVGGDATSSAVPITPPSVDPPTSDDRASVAPHPHRARRATLAVTGDVLAHSPLWRGAAANAGGVGYDFRPMFADIAPRISAADLAICHLETPIAPVDEELSTDPLYGVPAEIVDGIAHGGHDRCSTASNHVLDRGIAGIDRTVEVLQAAGIAQSGMARTPAEIEPRLFETNGITMSHLAYTYGTNGVPIPADQPWRSALIDVDRIVADLTAARSMGSEFTIVSLHWGEEKQSEPTAEQRAVAERLTATGLVDLVVGHHAHVVQPIERVNGVWVAYGLGNVLSNHPAADHWPTSSQDAVVVTFDLGVDEAGTVTVERPVAFPTWVDKTDGWVIRDVLAVLGDPASPKRLRDAATTSLERTRAVLGDAIPATP